jgi:hypothetical protein
MRKPNRTCVKRIDQLPFEDDVQGADNQKYLWGNAVYALGAVAMRAFAASGWFEDIVGTYPARRVVAVCHGGVVNVALGIVLGLAPDRPFFFDPHYTSLSRMVASRRGVRSIASLNEQSHLEARRSEGSRVERSGDARRSTTNTRDGSRSSRSTGPTFATPSTVRPRRGSPTRFARSKPTTLAMWQCSRARADTFVRAPISKR